LEERIREQAREQTQERNLPMEEVGLGRGLRRGDKDLSPISRLNFGSGVGKERGENGVNTF
jgi:hypothetical protein